MVILLTSRVDSLILLPGHISKWLDFTWSFNTVSHFSAEDPWISEMKFCYWFYTTQENIRIVFNLLKRNKPRR